MTERHTNIAEPTHIAEPNQKPADLVTSRAEASDNTPRPITLLLRIQASPVACAVGGPLSASRVLNPSGNLNPAREELISGPSRLPVGWRRQQDRQYCKRSPAYRPLIETHGAPHDTRRDPLNSQFNPDRALHLWQRM